MIIVYPIGMLANQGVAFDPDAQAFIDAVLTAGGTLSDAQQIGINNKVLNLKGVGPQNSTVDFWTSKMRCCFPYVGGNAASHAIELKSLATGSFTGGWTHNGNGALANGSDAHFDTGINQSTAFTSTTMTLCEDIGNNFSAGFKSLHGLVDGTQGNVLVINDGSDNSWYVLTQVGGDGMSLTTQANTIGYWSHRQNGNTLSMQKDGNDIVSVTAAPLTALNANIYVGANNFTGGGPTWYCDGLFRTSEYFNFCSDTQMDILAAINSAFQTAMR